MSLMKIFDYFFFNCFHSLKRCNIDELIDLSDLTWEQREQVLRELFARMNGNKVARAEETKLSAANEPTLAIENPKKSSDLTLDDDNDVDKNVTFLDRSDLKRRDDKLR